MRAPTLLLAVAVCASTTSAQTPAATSTTPPTTPPTTPAPASPGDTAVTLEEDAFEAIDEQQWCLAMRLFEAAHERGPAVGLLGNAALAAERANDLDGAVHNHTAIRDFPSASRSEKNDANKKLAALKKQIGKTGSGTACATLDVLRPPPAPPPVVVEAPPVVVEEAPPPPPDRRTPGFITAGVGGVVVVAGAAALTYGLLPWFAFSSAAQDVRDAEAARTDASAAQAAQTAARTDWEGHGRPFTIAGSAVVGAGVVAVVGGLVLALTQPAPTDDDAEPDVDTDIEGGRR